MIAHLAAHWPVYVGVVVVIALGLVLSSAPLEEETP